MPPRMTLELIARLVHAGVILVALRQAPRTWGQPPSLETRPRTWGQPPRLEDRVRSPGVMMGRTSNQSVRLLQRVMWQRF